MTNTKLAAVAAEASPRTRPSIYPEPFAARVQGRVKRPLGDLFGLAAFGVNLTRLPPGAQSALLHRHTQQDEFVYLLEGEVALVTEAGEETLRAGMCAGFKAGGAAHHLINRAASDAVFLEVGNRPAADQVEYPADDLKAVMGDDGKWRVAHKDGSLY